MEGEQRSVLMMLLESWAYFAKSLSMQPLVLPWDNERGHEQAWSMALCFVLALQLLPVEDCTLRGRSVI